MASLNAMNTSSTMTVSDRPLMTFALLAYNQERYVREAIEGAFAQTYSPLQIILSDDCSSDRTFDIIQQMSGAYTGPHQITLNRNPRNLGVGAHVNRVFELALGEIVVLGAGDDISLPHRVATLAAEFSDDVTVVYSSATVVDECGKVLRRESIYPDPQNETSYAYRASTYCRGVVGCSAAYSKKVFQGFGPLLPSTIAEDRVLAFRGYAVGKVRFVEEPLVKYRAHAQNIWSTRRVTSNEGLRQMVARRARIRRISYIQYGADLQSNGVMGADAADVAAARRIAAQRLIEAEAEELVLSRRWRERLAGLWRCMTRRMSLFTRVKLLLIGTTRWVYLYKLKRFGARLDASANAH